MKYAGFWEKFSKDKYTLRVLDYLVSMKDLGYEYSEEKLSQLSRTPKKHIPKAVENLKDYKLVEVNGKRPGRKIKLDTESENYKLFEKLTFQLIFIGIESTSIKKGFSKTKDLI